MALRINPRNIHVYFFQIRGWGQGSEIKTSEGTLNPRAPPCAHRNWGDWVQKISFKIFYYIFYYVIGALFIYFNKSLIN